MKKLLLMVTAVSAIGIFSCTKETKKINKIACDATQDISKGGYFPLTVGNYWKLEDKDAPSENNYNQFTVSNITKIVGGKTYYAILDVDVLNGVPDTETDTFYVSIEGNNIYTLYDEDQEYLMIKGDGFVNETWSVVSLDGGSKTVYKIISKDITKTVNGKNYSNVIQIEEKEYYDTDDNEVFEDVELQETTNYFYAKGVGEIQEDYSDGSGAILACFIIN